MPDLQMALQMAGIDTKWTAEASQPHSRVGLKSRGKISLSTGQKSRGTFVCALCLDQEMAISRYLHWLIVRNVEGI